MSVDHDEIDRITRPLLLVQFTIDRKVIDDIEVVEQGFVKGSLRGGIVFGGSGLVVALFPADDEYGSSIFRQGIQRFQGYGLIDLCRIQSENIEMACIAGIVPDCSEGGIGDDDVRCTGWGIAGCIFLCHGKSLFPKAVGPIRIQFVDDGVFRTGRHQQGTIACRRFVNNRFTVDSGQTAGQKGQRQRRGIRLLRHAGRCACSQIRLILIQPDHFPVGLDSGNMVFCIFADDIACRPDKPQFDGFIDLFVDRTELCAFGNSKQIGDFRSGLIDVPVFPAAFELGLEMP